MDLIIYLIDVHFVKMCGHVCMCLVAQVCPTLCDLMGCSLPCSSLHGIFQEYWSGLPFSPPGDLPHPGVEPTSPPLADGFFTTESHGCVCSHIMKLWFCFVIIQQILWVVWLRCVIMFWTIIVSWFFLSFSSQFRKLVWFSVGIGEGNGTWLQYPCLENPTGGGAWWAAVHGVTKSQI